MWTPLLLLSLSLLVTSTAATNVQIKVTNNPADQLVEVINKNRTASKLSFLYGNPGLACIALQYVKDYKGDCGAFGGPNANKRADSEIAGTFAPKCGVEASSLAPFTGRLLGCQSQKVSPSAAFSDVLMKNRKSVEIITDKNHTEVGAAVSGTGRGGPYFWCVLFSNGTAYSSFAFERGAPKISSPGCFSGANDKCNSAHSSRSHLRQYVLSTLVLAGYFLGL